MKIDRNALQIINTCQIFDRWMNPHRSGTSGVFAAIVYSLLLSKKSLPWPVRKEKLKKNHGRRLTSRGLHMTSPASWNKTHQNTLFKSCRLQTRCKLSPYFTSSRVVQQSCRRRYKRSQISSEAAPCTSLLMVASHSYSP